MLRNEREGSFKNPELVNIAKALGIKEKTLLEFASQRAVDALNHDDILLRILATNNVILPTVAKLAAKGDGTSEQIKLSHLFEEVELEKKELTKEFSIADALNTIPMFYDDPVYRYKIRPAKRTTLR